MSTPFILPHLWFQSTEGKLQSIFDYYQTVFGDHFKSGFIFPLGDTPSGACEVGNFQLLGQSYQVMGTAETHHALNDAFSLQLFCKDQNEIDHYWDYFTADGQESQCSWCIDKHGLRWQILPKNFGELMQKPNAKEVMMKQTKIVISEY